MLRAVIICPDQGRSTDLQEALGETRRVGVLRTLNSLPKGVDLVRLLRAAAPEVVFVSMESRRLALETAAGIEEQAPGTQIVAVNRSCDPEALLETMRAGIREFLSPPVDPEVVLQSIDLVAQIVE